MEETVNVLRIDSGIQISALSLSPTRLQLLMVSMVTEHTIHPLLWLRPLLHHWPHPKLRPFSADVYFQTCKVCQLSSGIKFLCANLEKDENSKVIDTVYTDNAVKLKMYCCLQ